MGTIITRPSALITGASSGIGEAFATRLASDGYDVVLVARREDLLARLASHLESSLQIHAEVLPADLSLPGDVTRVEERISQLHGLEFLINSAGFAILGRFADTPIQQYIDMIQCHNLAMLRLIQAALPTMLANRKGAVINVSSIGAFTPKRGDAVYCATKAFINLFSQALQSELIGTGIRVQALCPGFIISGFHDTPSYAPLQIKKRIPRFIWNTPDEIVTRSLAALQHNKVVYVPYIKNKMIVALSQLGFVDILIRVLASFFRHRQERGPS